MAKDSIEILDPRARITVARRILSREGCESQVAGHVSERVAGEDAFWISPFEYFDETLPERIVKVGFDLQLLEGDWEPSPAVWFHAAIYKGCPEVGSVIHTHSHYACVLATTGRPLGMYNDASSLFFNRQAIHINVDGDELVEKLQNRSGTVIVRNHGVIFAADSLEHATVEAITFERCSRIEVEAIPLGGRPHENEEYLQVLGEAYNKYYLSNMWEANVRRLRKSNPELFEMEPA